MAIKCQLPDVRTPRLVFTICPPPVAKDNLCRGYNHIPHPPGHSKIGATAATVFMYARKVKDPLLPKVIFSVLIMDFFLFSN
jgi:hypothetical protein